MNKYGHGCPCGCPCDEELWGEGCYDPKICEECLTYEGEPVIPNNKIIKIPPTELVKKKFHGVEYYVEV